MPGGSDGRSERALDDREAAAAARGGDEQAFARLVERHSGGLHRAVARILNDDTEAWDVVQMAFVRAWQRLESYNPQYSFATWLYRIGTNLAIDLLRARSSRERAHQAGMDHRLRLIGDREPISERVDGHEIDRILGQLVDSLTPQQRGAFVLREVEGYDTAEVATMLGCSPTTVRNHVFQARKVLRKELTTRFPEYVPSRYRG